MLTNCTVGNQCLWWVFDYPKRLIKFRRCWSDFDDIPSRCHSQNLMPLSDCLTRFWSLQLMKVRCPPPSRCLPPSDKMEHRDVPQLMVDDSPRSLWCDPRCMPDVHQILWTGRCPDSWVDGCRCCIGSTNQWCLSWCHPPKVVHSTRCGVQHDAPCTWCVRWMLQDVGPEECLGCPCTDGNPRCAGSSIWTYQRSVWCLHKLWWAFDSWSP